VGELTEISHASIVAPHPNATTGGDGVQVTVEQIPEVPVGNNGVLIRIRNEEGKNLGRLWIGQATVRWAKGSTREQNAKRLSVEEFVQYLNAHG
jgi:hypothetical protein